MSLIDPDIYNKNGYRPLNEHKRKNIINQIPVHEIFSKPKSGKFRDAIEDVLSNMDLKNPDNISQKAIKENVRKLIGQDITVQFSWDKSESINENNKEKQVHWSLDKVTIYFMNEANQIERIEYLPI